MNFCSSMTSTIYNAVSKKTRELDYLFISDKDNALTCFRENEPAYVQGIKISGPSDDHVNAFMSLFPNIDSLGHYRKLVKAESN